MRRVAESVQDRIGRSGLFLLCGLVLWYLGVVVASLMSPYRFDVRSPYLISAAGLVVGIVAGALHGRRWLRGGGISFLVVLFVVTVISLPIYANASAAAGVSSLRWQVWQRLICALCCKTCRRRLW